MGNCFEACGEDFERTVEMVADSRHRSPEEVKQTLVRLRESSGGTPTIDSCERASPLLSL